MKREDIVMGKAIAADIRKLYQERFERTAAHVAQMFCESLDKKLQELSEVNKSNNARHTIYIKDLYPVKEYELSKGMLEWRDVSSDEIENRDKLACQILVLIQEYYADWEVKLKKDWSSLSPFHPNSEFIFDAKFKPEVKIHRPEDFDAMFNARVQDMIQYFVREIRKSIAAQYGKQSSSTSIHVNSISYATELIFDDENAKFVYCMVVNALKKEGWKVSINSKSNVDTLWARANYSFLVSK